MHQRNHRKNGNKKRDVDANVKKSTHICVEKRLTHVLLMKFSC